MSWQEVALRDVLAFSSGKSITPGGEGAYPAYGSNGLIGRSPSALFPSGLIIGRVGAYCGSVKYSNAPFWASDNTIVARPRDEALDLRFSYFLLLNAKLNAWAGGAAQPLLTQTVLKPLRFSIPHLGEQRRIASILGAYDDLIEVNERRIALLEEMARRLFEEWFVQFRFPGYEGLSMVETTKGRAPEGWQFQSIEETFEIVGGGTPSKARSDFWADGTIAWYTPSDLTGAKTVYMEASELMITEEGLRGSSAHLFPPLCVMMTSRATIGAFAINTTPATTNQGFITCFPNARTPLCFLFFWLRSKVPDFMAHATGATFKEITKGVFRRLPILLPPPDLLARFEGLVSPILDAILCLERSQRRLAASRDLLLPRLLSGKTLIPATERELEDAP